VNSFKIQTLHMVRQPLTSACIHVLFSGWARVGGLVPQALADSNTIKNLLPPVHATCASFVLLEWIYSYYEKLISSEVTITQVVCTLTPPHPSFFRFHFSFFHVFDLLDQNNT
jgi:hypothetical protein